MRSVFRQLIEQQAVNPYISGHVTDGSSTFTFKVNNADVTVPVDTNGNWKWVVNRTITSLAGAFSSKTNIDYVYIKNIDDSSLTDCSNTFLSCTNLVYVDLKCLTMKNVTTTKAMFKSCSKLENIKWGNNLNLDKVAYMGDYSTQGMFSYCSVLNNSAVNDFLKNQKLSAVGTMRSFVAYCYNLTYIDMSAIEIKMNNPYTGFDWSFNYCTNLKTLKLGTIQNAANCPDLFDYCNELTNLEIGENKLSVNFKHSPKLTAQSVVNLFNAVAADGIILTFHATVYAMIQEQLAIVGSDIYNAYYNKIQQYNFTIASA